MIHFLAHIFYFVGIVALLFETYVLFNPASHIARRKRILGKDNDARTTSEKAWLVLIFFYNLWIIIGLLSDQSLGFLLLFVLLRMPGKKFTAIQVLRSLLCGLLVLFLLINHFHLMNNWVRMVQFFF